MSSGGPTTTSSNTSPRVAAGPTTTRRRVPDNISNSAVDAEKQLPHQQVSSSFSDFSEVETDETSAHVHAHAHSHAHPHPHAHHHHHLHPVTRYLLLRARILLCVPESLFLRVEQLALWVAGSVQGLRSGKYVGRKIFAALIGLLVMSVFLKVSLLGTGVEMNGRRFKSIENGQLILQRFKEDWAYAQRVITETRNEPSMPKRVLERLPVTLSLSLFTNALFSKKRFSLSSFLLVIALKIPFRESWFFLTPFAFSPCVENVQG